MYHDEIGFDEFGCHFKIENDSGTTFDAVINKNGDFLFDPIEYGGSGFKLVSFTEGLTLLTSIEANENTYKLYNLNNKLIFEDEVESNYVFSSEGFTFIKGRVYHEVGNMNTYTNYYDIIDSNGNVCTIN